MRQAFFIPFIVFGLLISCGKTANKVIPETASKTFIAEKEITIEGSPLRLPVGTRVTKSADGYELQVELPEGYGFLTSDFSAAKFTVPGPVFVPATYKCQCSASNNCQVFYQEDAGGFGCLHKSCSGSCTGSFTAKQQDIHGVIKLTNPEVSARKDEVIEKASLTSKGWEDFFSNAGIQAIIAEQYEQMYSQLPKPDFAQLAVSKAMQEDYVYLKVSLYGVPFYMLAPKEFESYKNIVETIPVSKASCACGSDKGTCQKKSWSFLHIWESFWCEGDCNGCELTVSSAVAPAARTF